MHESWILIKGRSNNVKRYFSFFLSIHIMYICGQLMDVNLYTWIRYKKVIEKLLGCYIDSHKTCNIILYSPGSDQQSDILRTCRYKIMVKNSTLFIILGFYKHFGPLLHLALDLLSQIIILS